MERLIVLHLGLNPNAIRLMNEGSLLVEFCAQGILGERIRAAGAGLPGILTDVGVDTLLADGKEAIEFAGQRPQFQSIDGNGGRCGNRRNRKPRTSWRHSTGGCAHSGSVERAGLCDRYVDYRRQ